MTVASNVLVLCSIYTLLYPLVSVVKRASLQLMSQQLKPHITAGSLRL